MSSKLTPVGVFDGVNVSGFGGEIVGDWIFGLVVGVFVGESVGKFVGKNVLRACRSTHQN